MPRRQITNREIAQALRDARGFVSTAARKLGLSRQAIYKRMERSPVLREIVDDECEAMRDTAETRLFELIDQGNLGAIIFYLKTQGRDRGYSQRVDVDLKGRMEHQGPMQVVFDGDWYGNAD